MNPEDKLIVDYIMEIDRMGTKEFCEFSGFPVPYFQEGQNTKELAHKFVTVDAIRWKKIVEYAKLIRRAKPAEEGGVKEWVINTHTGYISAPEFSERMYSKEHARVFTIEEAIKAQDLYKKQYPDQLFTIMPK